MTLVGFLGQRALLRFGQTNVDAAPKYSAREGQDGLVALLLSAHRRGVIPILKYTIHFLVGEFFGRHYGGPVVIGIFQAGIPRSCTAISERIMYGDEPMILQAENLVAYSIVIRQRAGIDDRTVIEQAAIISEQALDVQCVRGPNQALSVDCPLPISAVAREHDSLMFTAAPCEYLAKSPGSCARFRQPRLEIGPAAALQSVNDQRLRRTEAER